MEPLSAEERERFAAWLEAEAATDEMLVKQMERLGIPLAVERSRDAAAKLRVARQLRQTEGMGL